MAKKETVREQTRKLAAEFPKNLKRELKARGMTQWDLAAASGVHSSQVSRFCSGLKPSDAAAAAIVEALNG